MLLTLLLLVVSLGIVLWLIKRERQLKELSMHANALETELSKLRRVEDDVSQEFSRISHQPVDESLLDQLTGLPRKSVFDDRLNQLVLHSKRNNVHFAVIVLDVDQLSIINNKLGYDIGDKLLSSVARRVKGEVRQVDTVAYMGGGKFLFLLPQLIKGETAAFAAQRVQDAIIQAFLIDGKELYIRASMGISIYPTDGENEQTLLKNADSALTLAKRDGGNAYQFFQKQTNELAKREIALKKCLGRDDVIEKLTLDYEFYFDTNSSEIEMAQAVPVLHHPDLGLVRYGDFIKNAENSQMMPQMGEWLIHQTIAQIQTWQHEGFSLKRMLINVTQKQIQHPYFIPMLSKALQENYVSPDQLVFEITDKYNSVNAEAIEHIIVSLNQLGVGIAVTVFGLGHFSIQRITKIPFNYLKIDSKLLESLTQNRENKSILNMLIKQAAEMHVCIFAEGVNTDEQKKMLSVLGCHLMEGKIFSHYKTPVASTTTNV